MSKQPRTLEIEEDINFQRKEWAFQRIGVAVLFLLVLAALLGLTGMGGPASHAEAGERGGPLFVEYERFVRRGAKARMTLHFRSDPPGFIQFWVSAPYLDDVIVNSVAPIPQTVTVESVTARVYDTRRVSRRHRHGRDGASNIRQARRRGWHRRRRKRRHSATVTVLNEVSNGLSV